MVFGLIGEECEFSSEITGIRYKYQSMRTAIRIEVWMKTAPPDGFKDLGKNSTCPELGSLTDEKLKVYWVLRLWIEEHIKTVRKGLNIPSSSCTGH